MLASVENQKGANVSDGVAGFDLPSGFIVEDDIPVRNVRFWLYHHRSQVKLTVRPGQTLTFGFSEPTEEGWHGENVTIHYDADNRVIVRESACEGRDCDGFMGRYVTTAAMIGRLADGVKDLDDPEVVYPDWQRIEESQRDQYAEMAGY